MSDACMWKKDVKLLKCVACEWCAVWCEKCMLGEVGWKVILNSEGGVFSRLFHSRRKGTYRSDLPCNTHASVISFNMNSKVLAFLSFEGLHISRQGESIHSSIPFIHTIHPYHSSIPFIHTTHPYHSSIPLIHTIHPYHSSIPLIHTILHTILHSILHTILHTIPHHLPTVHIRNMKYDG